MVTYETLGVRPLINAWGTVTVVGGSLMEEETLAAMAEAGRRYVVIEELERAAGAHIAGRLGVPAAFICSGAAAGMALAAAACMAGTDPALRAQLPDTTGLRNEIVTFRTMRTYYDQGLRLAGARVVEIGFAKRSERWELERALTERTAAVSYIIEHAHIGALPLETVIEIAHSRNVPVIVNAAAELPPVENLSAFAGMGVDLTIFSGGKDLRGPQSTGLIVGRADLVEACMFHSAPNHSIGRGMKVGKEEIVGLVNAIERYLEQDFEREMAQWEAQVAAMIDALSGSPHVTARRVCPSEPGIQPTGIPRAYVSWSRAQCGLNPEEAKKALLEQEPRVVVGTTATELVLNPQMLREGEEQIVARQVCRVLLGNEQP